jgi:predicted component of type VI protein secretion system
MEQLAWTLSHHIGERLVRRGYHLGMPTRCTNQLFLKPQPWQSSDQDEFTQARQKVKAQVTQLPMPLPQLTRRTSQKTTLHTRRLRKISSKHLTLGNDHTDKVPSRIQNSRTTRPKQYLKTLIQQLGHKKQIVSKRLNKSNMPESDLVTHLNLTF